MAGARRLFSARELALVTCSMSAPARQPLARGRSLLLAGGARHTPLFNPSFPPGPHRPGRSLRPCAPFFHALRVGAPWADALDPFSALPDGQISEDSRILPYRPFLGPTAAVGRPDRAVTLSESDSADALVLYFAGRPRRHHIFPLPPAPPSSHAYDGPDPLHPVANAQIHVTSAAPPGPRPALLHAAPAPPESRPVSPFEAATAA